MKELPPAGWTTRYAPAPTGHLHLGHVLNALWVWGLARACGGRVLLRIEDHDRIRSRRELELDLCEDLAWLGFAADAPAVRQSERGDLYERSLARLAARGLVYPCACSRREIAAAGGEDEELRYPGTCRHGAVDPASTPVRRLRLEREEILFEDRLLGRRLQVPAEQCGDLAVRDRDGSWTYQFAVAVDDFEQGVEVVIRGQDLLASTGRQIQVAHLLGRSRPPIFLHHALVLRADGAKLSKARRDEGVRDLRAAGWTAGRVRAVAARAGGLLADDRTELEVGELPALFDRYGARSARG